MVLGIDPYLLQQSIFGVFFFMLGGYFLALYLKDNSIVDVMWGLGFIIIVGTCLYNTQIYAPLHVLVSILVTLWGLRLSGHIYLRKRGHAEDFRYAQWRKDWGKWVTIRSFFQVFFLQGLIMLIIATPIMFIFSNMYTPAHNLVLAGLFIWIIGFFFEAVGDYELVAFKKNKKNKGKIMTLGLWKYTRHPNYFGEMTMWWGIFIMALSLPEGYVFVFSPLLLTYLLVRVSGVPMLEKKWKKNKEYRRYVASTNALIPWFPKR